MVKRTITLDNFDANLFVDNKVSPPLYHYIVTTMDSAEILAWGQETSERAAEHAALECMASMRQRRRAAAV